MQLLLLNTYISAKDSGLSGNMGYINYPVKKETSVSPSAKKIIWCLQLAKLGIGEVCHMPGAQVALAEIMKCAWQAGSQIYS